MSVEEAKRVQRRGRSGNNRGYQGWAWEIEEKNGSLTLVVPDEIEAAIRDETHAQLEASEQRATQWGIENVRLHEQVADLQGELVLIGRLAQEKLGVNFQAIEDICARALSGASQGDGS